MHINALCFEQESAFCLGQTDIHCNAYSRFTSNNVTKCPIAYSVNFHDFPNGNGADIYFTKMTFTRMRRRFKTESFSERD
jgi:hypothetical protein